MKCVVEGCDRVRAKDSDRCAEHRWAQWTLRTPEWVRRAQEKRLPAKELAA